MKCAQHAADNPKFEKMDYSVIHDGGLKEIKGPTYMDEGGLIRRDWVISAKIKFLWVHKEFVTAGILPFYTYVISHQNVRPCYI